MDYIEPTPLYQSAASAAAEAIRRGILDGRYAPGDDLQERALAEELGLSRTPIREALLSLHASGLVENQRGRVARVARRTSAELMDTFELRASVEAYTAQRAAQRISAAEVAELFASCDRFVELLDTDDARLLVQENLVFHGIIHRASRNYRVSDILRNLLEMPLLYATYAWYSHERRVLVEQTHRAIAQAIADRDAACVETLMREHILEAGRAVAAGQPDPLAENAAADERSDPPAAAA